MSYQRKLSFTSGILARSETKSEIQKFCLHRYIDCDIQEDKGFFESTLYITLSGDELDHAKIDRAAFDLERKMNLAIEWIIKKNY